MKNTKYITRAAAIAGLYVALTLVFAPLSFGPMQIRFSEALTVFPIIWPEAISGLLIGCFLSNIVGGYGIVDAVVGSLATLVAAMLTRKCSKNRMVAALPPVLINGIVIGIMLHLVADAPLFLTMLYISAGQAVACYALGLPLLSAFERSGLERRL